MSAFYDLGVWRWIVWNCVLFNMSFGWFIYRKLWESYAWSKLSWLFLQNPNLATFESWWIWAILDESWSTLDKMMKYPSKWEFWQKILNFDCIWVTVDFCPNIVDFWALWAIDWANFLCKAWNLTWMILRIYYDIGEHLRSFGLKDIDATQNPNLG